MFDAFVNRGVEEAIFLRIQCVEKYARNSQRSHGIPHTDHLNRDVRQTICRCQFTFQFLLFVWVRLPVRGKYARNSSIVQIDRRDAKTGDHATDTARGKCAPAESEEEDFVARIVDIREERITILHLLEKALSHGSARQMVNRSTVGAEFG